MVDVRKYYNIIHICILYVWHKMFGKGNVTCAMGAKKAV